MGLFTRSLGWKPEEVEIFLVELRKQLDDRNYQLLDHALVPNISTPPFDIVYLLMRPIVISFMAESHLRVVVAARSDFDVIDTRMKLTEDLKVLRC